MKGTENVENNLGLMKFTQSEWVPPHELPDLSDKKVIAFDLETYEKTLSSL